MGQGIEVGAYKDEFNLTFKYRSKTGITTSVIQSEVIKAIPNKHILEFGLAATLAHYFGVGSSFAEYVTYGFDESTMALYQNANDRYREAHYGFYSLSLSQGE